MIVLTIFGGATIIVASNSPTTRVFLGRSWAILASRTGRYSLAAVLLVVALLWLLVWGESIALTLPIIGAVTLLHLAFVLLAIAALGGLLHLIGTPRWIAVLAVLGAVLMVAFWPDILRSYREQTAHGPRAASVHLQAPDGQQAEDSSCAKFSFDGTSCEARTDTGWIRPEAGTPAGLTFCWNPESSTGAFDRIMYLDEGGAPHTFVPGHAPEHATAYRFFPSHRYLKEHGMRSLAITYYLYDGECPAD
ncbi:MAG TPA: hypothetical protein VF439_01995 [Candidatus Paceibacterota bacterium]